VENGSNAVSSLNKFNTKKNDPALAVYFALGLFAILTCDNYFGVLSVALVGNGTEHLTYGTGCIAAASGVIFSYYFCLLWTRREKSARTILFTCYPLAVLLVVSIAFVKSPVTFFCLLILFHILVGFNAGLCARFLYRSYAGGSTGKLLGVSSCAGAAVCYFLYFAFPFDNTRMIPVNAISLTVVIFLMQYIATHRLNISALMLPVEAGEDSGSLQRRYKYVLYAVCGAIAIMSFMIGVNDIAVYSALLDSATPTSTSHFLPQLFYLPGLFLAGLLADLRRGKFLPVAALGCVFLISPVITLLNKPAQYLAYSWITYFVGGFFLMYIMTSLIAVVQRSRRPAFDAMMSGFLFFLFSGIGAFLSGVFIRADVFLSFSVYSVLALCLLFVFYLTGALRAVSLSDTEQNLEPAVSAPEKTLEEMAAAYGITERELEALRLLLAGKGTGAIAAEMHVVANTAQKYISSMIAKTGVESRSELLAKFAGRINDGN